MTAKQGSTLDAAADATAARRKSLGQVLVVDDDADLCELLELMLGKRGHGVSTVHSLADGIARLREERFDVLLADLHLGADSGLELCERALEIQPDLAVLVVTAFASMDSVVGALRAGAYDFVQKPIDVTSLAWVVERAVRHHRLREEVQRLRIEVDRRSGLSGMLGESAAMEHVMELTARVADSQAPVLITGASGTGKELVARSLHSQSRRRLRPFVAVNCAALPAALLESELFGHVRGAFTDARQTRRGLFLEAEDGTIFLDEIGELPMELQPKLLRALQDRTVRPVGSDEDVPFEARIVAATNRDLEQEVEDGNFREDLFYRINVIHIPVPSLSTRGRDVLLLAQHFLTRVTSRDDKPVKGLMPAAAEKLLDYDWPGNVRELENAIERAVALAQHDRITVDDLPERIREHERRRIVITDAGESEVLTLEQLEKRYILQVLDAVEGNKTRAAQLLGVDRRTLYRKLGRYESDEDRAGEQD